MEQTTISASQQAVFAQLKSLWENSRLPDALLLYGEAGALKEHFAKTLACLGVCQSENKPCMHCAACQRVMQEHHTEVSVYKGRGKANSFTVDTVRLIKEQAQVRPLESDVRFLILKDVHEMNQNAQNALLKLLEEPPAHTVLILTCQNKSALLPTILSRVSAFYLERVDMPFAAGLLKEQFPDKDDGTLLEAVELSLGDMELASSL